ncbi:MAG: phosphoribosylamine--glycine ligase, partial [Kordiimonadaceae bacterium]|nr:phosphoribosylamine--glycine ligase [Kordiimonadaceae bacterium]
GYPADYAKGMPISGLDADSGSATCKIFHAGTKKDGEDILATGGRVLNITSLADNVTQAKNDAYAALDKINWPDGFCRRDIGWRAVIREEND